VWSAYLTEAIETFGDRTEVAFASHHWPTWGSERVMDYLATQRDLYAYLHDQTLRYINQGYTGSEIAELIELPPALVNAWSTHGYYGAVSHNVKAIYQRYMGWFDANPGRLWPHPPAELAARYVEAMGGLDHVVQLAQAAFDSGDFRWAATLLDHAVFFDPDHAATRSLYADTLEQLGYGSENGTWRNFFLSGAAELRGGNFGTPAATAAPAILAQLTPEQIFDTLAISVDGPKAWDYRLTLNVTFTDLDANYKVTVRNGVLLSAKGDVDATAAVTLSLTKGRMLALLSGDTESAGIDLDGDATVLQTLLDVIQRGDPSFNIVTP
jgi:alkyl sulfatase BDS1-like metallo-beta-lactamase superfamily hydrolase